MTSDAELANHPDDAIGPRTAVHTRAICGCCRMQLQERPRFFYIGHREPRRRIRSFHWQRALVDSSRVIGWARGVDHSASFTVGLYRKTRRSVRNSGEGSQVPVRATDEAPTAINVINWNWSNIRQRCARDDSLTATTAPHMRLGGPGNRRWCYARAKRDARPHQQDGQWSALRVARRAGNNGVATLIERRAKLIADNRTRNQLIDLMVRPGDDVRADDPRRASS